MTNMRIDTSPHGLLLIAAIVLFVLAAIGVSLGQINLVAVGLALLAAAFLFG